MTGRASDAPFQCRQCPSRYMRLDHLHRHELKHEGQKTCVCKFCNAKFYRHDILHRHYKSCRQRGDCPIPSAQPRGRRKQACDQCAATKLACDSSRPCQTCAGKGLDCSWARVRERRPANTEVLSQVPQSNSTVDASPYPSEASPSLLDESADLANEEPSPMAALMPQVQTFTLGSMPVPFLLNFVSLETKTFVDTFGYASAAPEPLPILSLGISLNQPAWELSVGSGVMGHGRRSLQGRSSASLNAPNPPLLDDSYSQGFNVSGQDSLFDPRSGPLTGGSPDSTGLPDPMRRRLSELAMQLTDTFITLPKRHWARTTSAKIQDADKFFTLSNFQLFTQTFYHHFFPQCPIIHRPSCNLKIASLRLVLVICLAGALYSSLPEAIATAQSLLDLAEEFVFRNACFQELSKGKGSADQIQDCDAKLEAIQSAVVITFLQNWEGNEAARRRGRTERFNTIISSARALRLTTAQSSLPAAMGPGLQFDWYLWSIYETRVRVMYYIFILDSGFCIFHNYPPRLALAEIKADLPCPEDVYEAVDSTDCFQKAYNHNSAEPSSLERILKLLLAEDFGEEEKSILSTLTPLHYFIIINAFHIIIRTAHAISYSKIINDNVGRALSRWKSGWEIHKKQITTRQSKRLGFVKHAKEYWWLAKLQIYVAESDLEAQPEAATGLGLSSAEWEDDNMGYIRTLLERFCSSDFTNQA